MMAYYLDRQIVQRWAIEDLAELAADIAAPAGITLHAPSGAPGPRLVAAASGAAVLVIGRHEGSPLHTPAMVGMLHHALTHALCPVVVVPATEHDLKASDEDSSGS